MCDPENSQPLMTNWRRNYLLSWLACGEGIIGEGELGEPAEKSERK